MVDSSGLLPEESARLGSSGVATWARARARLTGGFNALPDKPEETLDATLRSLWLLAAGHPASVIAATSRELPELDVAQGRKLDDSIGRRLSGVPLAHLTERQSFMGHEMLAGPEALIPRVETEILGGAAIELLRQIVMSVPTPVVVDICTGCGNLAAVLASAAPSAIVYASDLSDEAVDLARRNMTFLRLEARVALRSGDLVAPFSGSGSVGPIDLLTCNPPYISTGRVTEMPEEIAGHEPSLAFDGGPLGIRILQRLIKEAPPLLKPGGWFAFEVGAGQGPAVQHRLDKSGEFDEIASVADDEGQIRVLLARRRRGSALS